MGLLAVHLDFAANILAGLADEVAMIESRDRALEAEGNQQADRDGDDVDEEIPPAMHGTVGRMNVEQMTLLAVYRLHRRVALSFGA